MKNNSIHLAYAAIIAALYAVLTHMQNLLFPGSASWAIQMRLSEALCVLAFFTPAAIPGLAVGCLIFNLSSPFILDIVMGTAATLLATTGMWLTRKITIKSYPLLGLIMPAVFNAFLVGWELTIYTDVGFWFNALCVAIGELAVLLVLGSALYYAIRSRHLEKKLFS